MPKIPSTSDDETWNRFSDIWIYCMTLHPGQGTLPGGPCLDCVTRYAISGPPPLPGPPAPPVVFREP